MWMSVAGDSLFVTLVLWTQECPLERGWMRMAARVAGMPRAYMGIMTCSSWPGHTGGIQGRWDFGKVFEKMEKEEKAGGLRGICFRLTEWQAKGRGH